MAPQTCSQTTKLKANSSSLDESATRHVSDQVLKNFNPPSNHDSDLSCPSPLSPTYDLIMNSLHSQVKNVSDDPESSFDEEELNGIYEKCQAIINHLHGSDGEQRSHDIDTENSTSEFMEDDPQEIACQLSSPPQPSCVPSVHHIIMCSMARPTAWAMAYQSLATLKYETWVDAHVLNFQLQSQWYAVQGRTHVRYVNLFSAIPSVSFGIHSLPEDQEIHLFQQHHLFNSLPVDPFVPIAFVVMQTNHFFMVVFEYQAGSAWVLGRCITDVPETSYPYCRDLHDDWTMWNGPFYWTHIAALHGYDAIDPDQVDVQAYNWAQNGFDCGPIASFVMESLMSNSLHGTHENAVHIPPIPCGHHLRLQMLAMVKETCRRSWEDYCYLSTTALPPGNIWLQWDDTEAVSEETITEITNEVAGEQHASIIRELNVVGANCLACQRINSKAQEHSPTSLDNNLPNDDNLEEDQPPLDAKSQHLRDLLRRYPYTGRARARDFLPPQAVHGIKILEEPSMRGPLEVITGQKNVKDWAATSMLCFPCPTLPVYLPAYQGHRWKPFDRTYDEYEGGPILESLHQDHNPYEIVKEPYYRPGIWSSFRDYGYCLLSFFSQMFYLDPPVRLFDHVLPVGVPNDYDSSCQIRDHVTGG
ncbi:hypothetical protein J3A83DRAFT_4366706 [Scleroderma citrinum]